MPRVLPHPERPLAVAHDRLALALRLSSGRIVDILNGKRGVSPETALRLGRYFGTSAAFWMNLQTKYDLEVAEREFGERIRSEVGAA